MNKDNELYFNTSKNHFLDIRTVNPYVFLSHAYNGSGGFLDGSYLMAYPRESFYTDRQKYSFYRNFIKAIINSMVEPVFSKPIVRTTTNDMFDSFLQNVDNKKTNMNKFTENVMIYSRLHGVIFVVMDNFSNELNTVSSRQDAINGRYFPYIYLQPAYYVNNYKVDYFNNLIEITFKTIDMIDGKKVDLYTTWDSLNTVREWKEGDKLIKTEANYHGLGVLPVIPVYSTNNDEILPLPPFYDIAKLNLAIYNKDSEIRDQERSQAFSIFYMQTDSNNNSITLGASNALIIPASSEITMPPNYVSPDTNILKTLMDNNKELINSIYEIASSQGVVGVQEAKSGIAASYKFISTKDQLERTCTIAKEYEMKVAEMFGKYTGELIDYVVTYPRKFDNIISIDFATLKDMLAIETTTDIQTEIKKLMVSDILDNLPQERLNELLDELDKVVIQPKNIKEE
jgi:hypothetical protein